MLQFQIWMLVHIIILSLRSFYDNWTANLALFHHLSLHPSLINSFWAVTLIIILHVQRPRRHAIDHHQASNQKNGKTPNRNVGEYSAPWTVAQEYYFLVPVFFGQDLFCFLEWASLINLEIRNKKRNILENLTVTISSVRSVSRYP